MSSELIERLRMAQSLAVSHPHFANISNTCRQAADALEAAASRERELEARLSSIKNYANHHESCSGCRPDKCDCGYIAAMAGEE